MLEDKYQRKVKENHKQLLHLGGVLVHFFVKFFCWERFTPELISVGNLPLFIWGNEFCCPLTSIKTSSHSLKSYWICCMVIKMLLTPCSRGRPWFKFHLCHLQAVFPEAWYWTSRNETTKSMETWTAMCLACGELSVCLDDWSCTTMGNNPDLNTSHEEWVDHVVKKKKGEKENDKMGKYLQSYYRQRANLPT